jgi:hypothetical protein
MENPTQLLVIDPWRFRVSRLRLAAYRKMDKNTVGGVHVAVEVALNFFLWERQRPFVGDLLADACEEAFRG